MKGSKGEESKGKTGRLVVKVSLSLSFLSFLQWIITGRPRAKVSKPEWIADKKID